MTRKPGQGMQRPSLGGIGSDFTVGRAQMTCSHDSWWRLGEGFPWRCAVCHPPAVAKYERAEKRP